MKYLSLDSVKRAFIACREKTQNKFWGLLSILSVIDSEILPGVSYSIQTDKISNILERLFRLENDKKNYSSNNQWSIIFSNKWIEEFPEMMLTGKPNIYQIAVWFLRNESFPDDVSKNTLLSLFINRIHLKQQFAETIFSFAPIDIEFSDSQYSEQQLLSGISDALNAGPDNPSYRTLSFEEKPFIKSNPGSLGQAPFIQTLYANQGIQKCLIITQFNFHDYYNVSNDNNKYPKVKNIMNIQQIFYGAPGTGKSHAINDQTKDENVIRTTFHPDSDYSTFVGAYKPTTREVDLRDVSGHKIVENGSVVREERIVYEFVAQAFLQSYVNAWKLYAENPAEPAKQYLVIEEINRGNCAQIFGDLFQLLDRNDYGFSDYPIAADSDLSKHLKKELAGLTLSNADSINAMYDGRDVATEILAGKILILPNNLYIWATMNTSDQSLFPIDSAFKRRWEWKYVPINTHKENWSIAVNGKLYSWSSFLDKINYEINDTTHSEDKKLGFYFCKAVNGVIPADRFVGKVLFYLYNDVFKDYGFARDFFKDESSQVISFQKFFNCTDGSTNDNTVEKILKNLNVDLTGNAADADPQIDSEESTADALLDEDGNTPAMQTNDLSKYAINDAGAFGKGSVAYEVMKLYIAKHPQKTALEVANDWLALGVEKVPNFFETETMHETRRQKATDVRFDKRSESVTLADGQKIYVSNQYTQERIDEVMAKINAANWGITISKL